MKIEACDSNAITYVLCVSQKSFAYRGVSLWNSLDLDTKMAPTINAFKFKLKENNPLYILRCIVHIYIYTSLIWSYSALFILNFVEYHFLIL